MSRPAMKISSATVVLLLLIVSFGCETDPNLGGLVQTCITFVPLAPPADGVVAPLSSDTSDCAVAEVELVVTGVDDIWSAHFEVDYPSGFSQIFEVVDRRPGSLHRFFPSTTRRRRTTKSRKRSTLSCTRGLR